MSQDELFHENGDPYRTQAIVLALEKVKPRYRIRKELNNFSSWQKHEFIYVIQKRFWIFWINRDYHYEINEAIKEVSSLINKDKAEKEAQALVEKKRARKLKPITVWDDTKLKE